MSDFIDLCFGVFIVACIARLSGLTLEEYYKLSPEQQQKIVKSLLEAQKSLTANTAEPVKGTSLTVQEQPFNRPVLQVRKAEKRDFGLCRLDGCLCRWDDCYCRRTEVCTLEVNFACEWWQTNNWFNRYQLRKKKEVKACKNP